MRIAPRDLKFHTVWLALTYNCNNKCVWCYADSDQIKNRTKNMDADLAEKSVKLIKELGVHDVILIGGEPTCYNLEQVLRDIKSNGMRAVLVTNGRRLSSMQYANKLKDCGLDAVAISIEGCDAEQHENATKIKGSFDETMRGLENCISAGIKTTTETTVSALNYNDVHQILDFLIAKGVKEPVFNICTAMSCDRREYAVSPLDAAKVVESLYKHGKSKNTDVVFLTPLPFCNFSNRAIAEEMLSKGVLNPSCYMFFGTNFVIDYNGDILPCVHFTGKPFFNLVAEKAFDAGTFLKKYTAAEGVSKKFRDQLWTYPSEKCISDPLFGKCLGGCPIFWFSYDPKEQIKGIESYAARSV